MRWQWFLTILLGLGWLLVACANAEWSWDKLKAKSGHNSSPVALLGALFAFGALAACPWEHPHKWVLLVPALVLDVGSGPLVVLSVVALILEGISVQGRRVAGGYLSTIEKRIARTSWIMKLGLGFLIWFVLAGGLALEKGIGEWVLIIVVIIYWPLLLAWFWRLRKYSLHEEKP